MKHPRMLYFASFSELWERFSFYIVEALLVIYLINSKHLPQAESYQIVGTYIANSFILTVFGAYFGQNILGFRASVYFGGFLMAIGYALLLDIDTKYLTEALALIALGSSFFKPNMACFIGSLYKTKGNARYAAAYNLYYAAIMIGVIISTSISGYVVHYLGWGANFFLAASAMLIACFVFWIGNKITQKQTHLSTISLLNLGIYRWPLTLIFCTFIWYVIHFTLLYPILANIEFISVTGILIALFYYESRQTNSLPRFLSCLVLLIFSGVFWALLFQQFFSFNMIILNLINRHVGNFFLPAPFFMGLESVFVIIFSSLIGKFTIKQKKPYDFFTKYAFAFGFCTFSLMVLMIALIMNIRPYFTWIVLSYALLGMGEAILAPTALAMIAPLNREKILGVMMAALYISWGLGTKMADVLAQWSVIPEQTMKFSQMNGIFLHAVTYYAMIALSSCIICIIVGKFLLPKYD